jgi:hypothetical protein
MKSNQHTTEDIIRILRQADAEDSVDAVCRMHSISKATYHSWKINGPNHSIQLRRFGGAGAASAAAARSVGPPLADSAGPTQGQSVLVSLPPRSRRSR